MTLNKIYTLSIQNADRMNLHFYYHQQTSVLPLKKEKKNLSQIFIAQKKNMVVVYFIIFFSLSTCGMGFVIMCAG